MTGTLTPHPSDSYLLIEDSPSDAALLEDALYQGKSGRMLSIHRCGTLSSGIKIAERERFDVILLDLHLPDSEGIATFRTLKTRVTNIPVVILTATAGEDLACQAMDEGAQDVIYKDRLDAYWILHSIKRATSRHQLQRRMRQAEERELQAAYRANQAKSDFLAVLSHEIRTPLGAMIMATDILAQEISADPEQLEILQMIRRNGDHLLFLLNDLLDLSKIEAGSLSVEKRAMNVREDISDILKTFASAASAKNITLTYDIDLNVVDVIWSDPTRFRQILSNLVANAIKFTHSGGVTVQVTQCTLADNPYISITVTDTGIGITADQAEGLFRAFTQADASIVRRFGGTGLGLSLAKRLATALGGDVVLAASFAGKGSTFELKLPIDGSDVSDFIFGNHVIKSYVSLDAAKSVC